MVQEQEFSRDDYVRLLTSVQIATNLFEAQVDSDGIVEDSPDLSVQSTNILNQLNSLYDYLIDIIYEPEVVTTDYVELNDEDIIYEWTDDE